MGLLRRSNLLSAYNAKQIELLSEGAERTYAGNRLREVAKSFSFGTQYDIFLSHSYDDARVIKQIHDLLKEKGWSVYVDWIEDDSLDRRTISPASATVIRNRMDTCRSLLYVTSESAEKSVWMPWELGYMDARTGIVAVAPILGDDDKDFDGREYLGLYPYLDLTGSDFYIHESVEKWVGLDRWMEGVRPGA